MSRLYPLRDATPPYLLEINKVVRDNMENDGMPDRAFVEKVYDEMFDEAKSLFKEHPVCGDFEFGLCRRHIINHGCETIHYDELDVKEFPWKGKRLGCCGSCESNWSPKGCKTKNLLCKLFVCDAMMNDGHAKPILAALDKIAQKARRLGFYMSYYHTKDELLDATMNRIKDARWSKETKTGYAAEWRKLIE